MRPGWYTFSRCKKGQGGGAFVRLNSSGSGQAFIRHGALSVDAAFNSSAGFCAHFW